MILNREIIQTADGSSSILITDWKEQYHSKHGAIQEAQYVFIQHGIEKIIPKKTITILEIGFGTGLNALLSRLYAEQNEQQIHYISLEKYPLNTSEIEALNYPKYINHPHATSYFQVLHSCQWNISQLLSPKFSIQKIMTDFLTISQLKLPIIDLVFFDAFSYDHQPHLWSIDIFHMLYNCCAPKALLTTYAARGIIKRNMQAAGWEVQKIAGPPGKREMLQAFKRIA